MKAIEKSRIQEIVSLHVEIGNLLKVTVDKVIRMGKLLTAQKDDMKHGEFISWVKKNLPFTDRTAQRYMKAYKHRDYLKTTGVSLLNDAYKKIVQKETEERETRAIEYAKERKQRDDIKTRKEHPKAVKEFLDEMKEFDVAAKQAVTCKDIFAPEALQFIRTKHNQIEASMTLLDGDKNGIEACIDRQAQTNVALRELLDSDADIGNARLKYLLLLMKRTTHMIAERIPDATERLLKEDEVPAFE